MIPRAVTEMFVAGAIENMHPDTVRLHMDRDYIRQRNYWPDNPDNFLKPGKTHEASVAVAPPEDPYREWINAEQTKGLTQAFKKRPSILRKKAEQ